MGTEQHPELPIDAEEGQIVPQACREYIVNKISKVVVPEPDITANHDWRMRELRAYCKYLERKALERSETPDQYYIEVATIIFHLRIQVEQRPPAHPHDPYSIIPPPHELADFMGLTQEELEEFDEEQNPQVAPEQEEALAMEAVTQDVRDEVINRMCTMLFPPPDEFAMADGRMANILRQLAEIEAEAFRNADDRNDYYQRASLLAYRHQRHLLRTGQSYCEVIIYQPIFPIIGENVPVEMPEL